MSYVLRGARLTVEETLAGQIKIVYQGKALEYKDLLVRDHQGQVKNRKGIVIGSGSPVGAKTALSSMLELGHLYLA